MFLHMAVSCMYCFVIHPGNRWMDIVEFSVAAFGHFTQERIMFFPPAAWLLAFFVELIALKLCYNVNRFVISVTANYDQRSVLMPCSHRRLQETVEWLVSLSLAVWIEWISDSLRQSWTVWTKNVKTVQIHSHRLRLTHKYLPFATIYLSACRVFIDRLLPHSMPAELETVADLVHIAEWRDQTRVGSVN